MDIVGNPWKSMKIYATQRYIASARPPRFALERASSSLPRPPTQIVACLIMNLYILLHNWASVYYGPANFLEILPSGLIGVPNFLIGDALSIEQWNQLK